jgi:steroid delta-isomerase-like uncharacterized protein
VNPKQLAHAFIRCCAEHDVEGLAAIIADDYIQHNPTVPAGLAGLQDGLRGFLSVFPDLAVELQDLIAEGDRVVARMRWSGTHSAALFGMAATGRSASWEGIDIWRVENGKLAEHWDVVDWAGLMAQLQA